MCQDVCIEINEVVENISIEVRDFSVSNIISQDAGNSIVLGDDGLLFSPTSGGGGGSVESVNGILPDVSGNVVVPIPIVPDFATELEVNAGVVSNKTISPNTLSGWWTYQKGLIQTFAQKITFNLGVLFTPQAIPTHERGRVYFDDVNDCLAYMDSVSGTSVQVGQELIMRVRNNTGATILNGSVVYVSGAIGQNSTIALAQANTMPTSEIIGIATHDIVNNTIGKVCVFGQVNDLDTSAFSDGNSVFLSSSVAGGLVIIPPVSPNFVVTVGVVEHSHPTQGKILVRPQRALANNNSLGTSQSVSATQNAVKNYVDNGLLSKQNNLNATNLGQIIYDELAIKSTPSDNDKIVMYDSITGEAVTAKFSSFRDQVYKTISTNTVIDDSFHGALVWITATCNLTLPAGLRPDFYMNAKTFDTATASYLASGTVINSQSDGTVQAPSSMCNISTFSTNNLIISGGGLS